LALACKRKRESRLIFSWFEVYSFLESAKIKVFVRFQTTKHTFLSKKPAFELTPIWINPLSGKKSLLTDNFRSAQITTGLTFARS